MRMFNWRFVALMVLFFSSSITVSANDDEAQIRAVVMDYFEGIGEGSYEKLSNAFHVKSRMLTSEKDDEGKAYLRIWEMEPTIKRWSKSTPPKRERTGEILNMHIMDGRLASVSFDLNGSYFDLLTLTKMDGQWKIISKAFIRQNKE